LFPAYSATIHPLCRFAPDAHHRGRHALFRFLPHRGAGTRHRHRFAAALGRPGRRPRRLRNDRLDAQRRLVSLAVASANVGTTDTLTVSADTGDTTLPLSLFLCQTDPADGACLAAPAATVTLTDAAGATPTFSVSVTASQPIGFDPAAARIFLRFKDSNGVSHGSTSVAVTTD
jgi:hypothetical protein